MVSAREVGDLVGEGTVEDYVFTITVPTNLDFALDPAQESLGPSQISNVDFSFESTSNFATLIAFYLKVVTADGVTLLDDSEMDGYALFSASEKELSFGAIVAKTDDGTDIVYDEDNDDSIIAAAKTDGKFEFGIVLAGKGVELDGTIDEDLLNTADMNASFQFYSRMNAYADWQDDDVSLSGVYMLAAVNPATLKLGVIEADTTGLVNVTLPSVTPPAPPYGFQDDGEGFIDNIDNAYNAEVFGSTVVGYADFTIDKATIGVSGALVPFAFGDTDYREAKLFLDSSDVTGLSGNFTSDGLVLVSAFSAAAAGTFEFFIVLDNGDLFQFDLILVD